MDAIKLIKETPSWYRKAERMTEEAFYNVYMPGAEEHWLLAQLRKDPAYLPDLSRLAIIKDEVVGGIYAWKASLRTLKGETIGILSFGPLGVKPPFQRQGVGKRLVHELMIQGKKEGYKAIVITGVPTYYPLFGFKPCTELALSMMDGSQFPALMGLSLEPGFLESLGPSKFEEPSVMETRPTKKELEAFDASFPPLEKKVQPGQWKKPNV